MLKIDVEDKLQVEPSDFESACVAVMGSRGFGKSNTIQRLCEQLLPYFPMVIVDPHSEYWGLQERFDILIAGKSDHANLPIHLGSLGKLAEISYHERLPLILDLSLFDDEDERPAIVHEFFVRLKELGVQEKMPYGIVLEEAHNFVPESAALTPARKLMRWYAEEGRKFGFGMFLATQSATRISKRILEACEILFLHGVNTGNQVDVYKSLLPFSRAETERIAMGLDTGDAIVRYKRRLVEVVHVAQCETFHVGATPTLSGSAAPELRRLDAALLDSLREALAMPDEAEPADQSQHIDKLKRQIAELQRQLAAPAKVEPVEVRVEVPVLPDEQAAQLREAACAMIEMGTQILGTLERIVYPMQIVTVPSVDGPVQALAVQDAPDEWKSPLQTTNGIRRQEREFEALLGDIRKLPGLHRKLLSYLMERSGRNFTVSELARFLGVSTGHLVDHPPTIPMRLGLIKRVGRSSKDYQYQGTVRTYLVENFPDLNTEDLFQRLVGVK